MGIRPEWGVGQTVVVRVHMPPEPGATEVGPVPHSVLLLQEAIEAIAESAFKTSPYPVILSFENHVDSCVSRPISPYSPSSPTLLPWPSSPKPFPATPHLLPSPPASPKAGVGGRGNKGKGKRVATELLTPLPADPASRLRWLSTAGPCLGTCCSRSRWRSSQ